MRSMFLVVSYLIYVGHLYHLGIGLQLEVQHHQKHNQHRSDPFSKADGVHTTEKSNQQSLYLFWLPAELILNQFPFQILRPGQ